jgi:Recombinase
MAKIERVHETWSRPITAEYLARQASYGWKLVSIVWEREIEPDPNAPPPREEEAPYGLRVSADAVHLEENTAELEVLLVIMEGIVQDHRLSQIAEDLNGRDFRTRNGAMWTPIAVFGLLPRLIETGPRIFNSEEWIVRREKIRNTIASY